jgi:hypothetical protein
MSEATMDALARMHVAGATATMMSAATGRSPGSIRQFLDGPGADRVERIRGLVLRETATHYFEMMALLPQVRHVLQGGLTSPGLEEKVRIELAKWFHETLVPRPAQRSEVSMHLTGSIEHDVSGVLAEIGRDLALLRAEQAGHDPLARVRIGDEALPRMALVEPGPDAA